MEDVLVKYGKNTYRSKNLSKEYVKEYVDRSAVKNLVGVPQNALLDEREIGLTTFQIPLLAFDR